MSMGVPRQQPGTGTSPPIPDQLRPTPLEMASGVCLGEHRGPRLPDVRPDVTPLAALEQAVLPALLHPPCLVSFSGGRDSSTVLAVATRVARREDLPLPIPATMQFLGPETHETSWQELVVRHLGLDDWVRLDILDELDLLGPVARDVIGRHGLLWPPNVHVMKPVMDAAAGGSLLTGVEADGLFGTWRWVKVAKVAARRARPNRKDMVRLAYAVSPLAVRRAVATRTEHFPLPWLRPDAQRVVDKAFAEERASEPLRWDRWVGWWSRRRYHIVGRAAIEVVATAAGTRILHPFHDPHFLAALSRHGGWYGYGYRADVMRANFSEVLPEAVITRTSKAAFASTFWGDATRRFVDDWDGTGVDETRVDIDALRKAWTAERPDFRSASVLQSAWLACLSRPLGPDGKSEKSANEDS